MDRLMEIPVLTRVQGKGISIPNSGTYTLPTKFVQICFLQLFPPSKENKWINYKAFSDYVINLLVLKIDQNY